MKCLVIAENREGKLLENYRELVSFAAEVDGECVMFTVGGAEMPQFAGRLYLADSSLYSEYNPTVHTQLLVDVVAKEQPDLIVFMHSSYGWDLAPRLAVGLGVPQVSEVVGVAEGGWIVPACNAKLQRTVAGSGERTILTLQAGAFSADGKAGGQPEVIEMSSTTVSQVQLVGYEKADSGGVDLSKAEVIVSAGRGVGKPENVDMVAKLAEALGGEYGASRPVVDAEWVDHNRQVGTTGMTVAPKLYVACGISGAVQHLAGMKQSEFVVAVNTDRDAPIGEVADVFVVADLKQFLPALTEQLQAG